MTKKMYLWLSSAFTLIMFFLIIIIYFFSLGNINEVIYPTYEYENYINRSENKIFTNDGGKQLYEAENMIFDDGFENIFKINASNKHVIISNKNNANSRIIINSDGDYKVQLEICLNYVSEVDTLSNALFNIKINQKDIENQSRIKSCKNDLQFLENIIGEIELKNGENEILFSSKISGFSFDYFTLNSLEKRKSEEKVIGKEFFEFDPYSSRQILETEVFRYDENVLTYYDENYSSFYYIQILTGHEINLFINSEINIISNVTFNAWGNICQININNEEIKNISLFKNKNEIEIGNIDLKKGVNVITLNAYNGDLFIDNLIFNADINYSNENNTKKFEAERANLFGECRIEKNDNVSEGYNVGYCFKDSEVSFDILTNSMINAYLTINMSYVGENNLLSEIMEIKVNEEIINLNDCINFYTGNYDLYNYVYIGKINIYKGNNNIKIKSITGNYNLDFITLSSWNIEENIFEAENASLTNKGIIENNEMASNGKNIGYLANNSVCEFNIFSEESSTYNLSIRMSLGINYMIKLSDCMILKINNEIYDIDNIEIEGNGIWTNFVIVEIGEINLNNKMNIISLICKEITFNLDYILLTK